jgi:recombination protein RecA
MEEKPEFTKEVEALVRQKLEMGAVVSANSVGAPDPEDEDDEEFEEEEV